MAYRVVDMWEILNALRRLGRGESQAAVDRHTEHCRKAGRRYVTTAVALGWSPGAEEPTEELAAPQLHPGHSKLTIPPARRVALAYALLSH